MAACLVAGGAGFIESHLTDALVKSGHQVRVLDDLSTGNIGIAQVKSVENAAAGLREFGWPRRQPPAIMQTMLPAVQTLGAAHHGGCMGDAEAACFEQLVEWMRARGDDPYPDFDYRARRGAVQTRPKNAKSTLGSV
jgi:nucleoside-diphosphate-sugar epimerase